MEGYRLLWGDTHTHMDDLSAADRLLQAARDNIDFTAVLLYPFRYETVRGLRVETTRNRPEFLDQWELLNEVSRRHNEPGLFTTFPGYEWHGNRTCYGDHNVLYRQEGQPLDDTWALPDLYAALRQRTGLAIPHHTAYRVGARGKDWGTFDPALSPVMEIYSQHGSSEEVDAPQFLEYNSSMGPGTSGGTLADALARGVRVGVIGSNDGPGLPGRWGMGRAAVWARENTRAAIWDSLLARRTYAVTGDRIRLDVEVDGVAMGGELRAGHSVDVAVTAIGSQAIDKIELLQNGRIVAKYAHLGDPRQGNRTHPSAKLLIEAGWGPAQHNGFVLPAEGWRWDGRLYVEAGRILSVEKCFSLPGQRVTLEGDQLCHWHLLTAARQTRNTPGLRQGLVFELAYGEATVVDLRVEGRHLRLPLQECLTRAFLLPLTEEIETLGRQQFGLEPAAVSNPDAYYQNARKLLVHRAVPRWETHVGHVFPSVRLLAGPNALYVRVTQANGQMAWSSPIWIDPY